LSLLCSAGLSTNVFSQNLAQNLYAAIFVKLAVCSTNQTKLALTAPMSKPFRGALDRPEVAVDWFHFQSSHQSRHHWQASEQQLR